MLTLALGFAVVTQLRQTQQEGLSSLRETDRAFYVTGMMGFGFNAVTGDFSRGASGFWIEKGELAFPVSELTISGNLDAMLKGVDLVANDLELKASTASPTFRVDKMTIGGT